MKKRTQGILLIIVALGIMVYGLYSFLVKPEKHIKNNVTTESPNDIEKVEREKTDKIEPEKQTGEDLKEGYYISENFTLKNQSDEVRQNIEGKEDELVIAIQNTLYENGFAGIESAKVIGIETPDYTDEIILTITTGANNDITINAIYNSTAQIWQLIMW